MAAFEPAEPHSELVDRRQGVPLRPLEVRAADGRPLGHADTEVIKLAGAAAAEGGGPGTSE